MNSPKTTKDKRSYDLLLKSMLLGFYCFVLFFSNKSNNIQIKPNAKNNKRSLDIKIALFLSRSMKVFSSMFQNLTVLHPIFSA